MPALNKPYENYERPGLVVAYRVSNVLIQKGALVGVNPVGHIVPMAHGTANLRFVGVANETVDNTTGSIGAKTVNVTKAGSFVFVPTSGSIASLSDLGKEAFANTDWEIQVAATGLTNSYKIGTVVSLETSSVGTAGWRIRIDNYSL